MKPKINFKRSKIDLPNIDSQKFKIDSQRPKPDSQGPKFRKLSVFVDTEGGCEENVIFFVFDQNLEGF